MTSLPILSRRLLDEQKGMAVHDGSESSLPERAVQFGTGALLRGLVDACLDEANARGAFNGRVVMIGSTGSGRDARLNAQEGLFTLVSQGIVDSQPHREVRVIGVVSRALAAATEWKEVLRCAESPTIECIFSNTTEVGIVLHEQDAAEAPALPQSFPARLTRFLEHRARHFDYDPTRAPVVIPCELIDRNGTRLRDIVHALARRWALDPRFVRWLDAVVFCDTLVDRIVPGAPTAAQREELRTLLGYEDEMLTMCEPYRLFAIQGDDALRARLGFGGERGVIVTPDIGPYRERKVRLLNGAHTALVSLALLAGHRTVRDAVRDPALGPLLRRVLFDEMVPSLQVPGALEFAHQVLDRFANPHVEHSLWDITLQGTAKVRVRLVPTILAHAERTGEAPRGVAQAFAGFVAMQRGVLHDARRAAGLPVPADQGGERVREHWRAMSEAAGPASGGVHEVARSVCADMSLWETDLSVVPRFVELVGDALGGLLTLGVADTLRAGAHAAPEIDGPS